MPKRQQVGYAFVSCWFVYNLSKDVVLKLFGYNDVVLLAACRVLTDAVARLTDGEQRFNWRSTASVENAT